VDEQGEWTRQAIDVMTAWANGEEGSNLSLASRVGEDVGAGPEGALKLTVGLINLAGILLCQLEEQSGSDKSTLLRDAAAVTL
jgi:hypothetical protein